jgi:biopolymer transport protein ExbB
MKSLLTMICLLFSFSTYAESFDELLNSIKQQTRQELAEAQKRVQRFKSEKENQAALLAEAKSRLDGLVNENERLLAELDANEQLLAQKEEALQRKVGDLGEMFGAVRQVAGELKAEFANSMTSVQYPKRSRFIDTLAQSKALADVTTLEQLWYLMLQEMGETGKTRSLNVAVTQTDGKTVNREVVRIGSYVAISGDEYLQYGFETNTLSTLQRQPGVRYRDMVENFTASGGDLVKIMIDPTRGQLLTMLTQKPNLWERIQQGGIIGYIILSLGAIGLLVAVLRYLYLSLVSSKIDTQAKNLLEPVNNNPLGRVALVYRENEDKPLQEREIALEEAMLKEMPVIERYNGLIKLLAAVAPLLGLLGTVIGMIITFQTITLFGTSDPKLMAGGISTALVTTVLGLSVAIPLLFAHTFITSKSKRIIDVVEHQSVGLIARES